MQPSVATTRSAYRDDSFDLARLHHQRRWWILTACCVVTFAQLTEPHLWVIGLDIPASAFGTAWREYRFLSNLGVMIFVAFQLIGGVLGDLYGRRRVLLIGTIGTIVCNLLSLLAWNLPSLIALRGLTGLFGAIAFPLAMGMIRLFFVGDERKTAMVIYSFVTGAGTLASLIAIPIESWFGWRWALFIPILAGLAGTRLVVKHLPESSAAGGVGRVEAIAAATWTLVTLVLMFGLVVAHTSGDWFNPLSLTAFGFGLAGLLVIFVWSRRTAHPALFERAAHVPRHFLSIMLLMTGVFSFALSGYILQLYQFFFTVEQLSGFVAGLALAPIILGNLFTLRWASRFAIKQPRHLVVASGLAMMGIAVLLSSLARPNFPYLLFVPLMTLFGLGFMVASAAWATFFFSVLPADLAGVSAGVNRAAGLVGGALAGVVLAGIVELTGLTNFTTRLADLNLSEAEQELALKTLETLLRSNLSADELAQQPDALLALGLLSAYRESYSVAISSALFTVAAVCLACSAFAWFWLRHSELARRVAAEQLALE